MRRPFKISNIGIPKKHHSLRTPFRVDTPIAESNEYPKILSLAGAQHSPAPAMLHSNVNNLEKMRPGPGHPAHFFCQCRVRR